MNSKLKTRKFLATPRKNRQRVTDEGRVAGIILDKTCRRDLDEILQNLKDAPVSYERVSAITRLHETIMWLGLDLKRLGEADPYPTSRDPSSPVVHPSSEGLRH